MGGRGGRGTLPARVCRRRVTHTRRRYDWGRTARLAIFNGAFMGPLGHHYYKLLDAVRGGGGGVWGGEAWVLNGRPPIDLCVPSQFLQSVLPHAPKSLAAIASKLAIDQLIFAPVCTLIFYAYKVATELRAGCARARACSAAARRSCTRAPLCHPATPWRAESTCRS